MNLDDIKGRTYTNPADFWRDIERVVADSCNYMRASWVAEARKEVAERLKYLDLEDAYGELETLIRELENG